MCLSVARSGNNLFRGVLSIDPGKTNLALGFVTYKISSNLTDATSYNLRWFALWNLNIYHPCSNNNSNNNNQTKIESDKKRKYISPQNGLQSNLTALYMLLSHSKEINYLINFPEAVTVCIEQQEGLGSKDFKNIGLISQLQRLNAVLGSLWQYFTNFGIKVIIRSKTAKWGWASIFGKSRAERKMQIVRYVGLLLKYSQSEINRKMFIAFSALKECQKEHPADCMLQAMHFIREISYVNKKAYSNRLSPVIERMLMVGKRRDYFKAIKAIDDNEWYRELADNILD